MQALIRKFRAGFALISILVVAGALASCAEKHTELVSDPSDKKEGLVPWNKPEPWESGGNLAGMTDKR
jgi:hypothetical protein